MRRITPVWTLLLGVWIFGAFCSDLYYLYSDRRACIERDGWIRGWLWCSEGGRSPYDVYGLLRGLLWPVDLGMYILQSPVHEQSEYVSDDHSEHRPTPEAFGAKKLTPDQLTIIASRCSELSTAYKQSLPSHQPLNEGYVDLCISAHSQAALAERPSLLTMTTLEYSRYAQRHELTSEQRDSLLRDYEGYATTCQLLTEKTMFVQPLVKKDLKPGVTVEADQIAAVVIKWDPEIKKSTPMHFRALSEHFQNAGLFGNTLEYFMDEFDLCLSLSEVFPGMMRDKDRLSSDVTRIKNKYRAEIADGFQATQPIRDAIYGGKSESDQKGVSAP